MLVSLSVADLRGSFMEELGLLVDRPKGRRS